MNIPNSLGTIVFLYENKSYNEGATIDIDDIVVTYYGGATVTETFEYPNNHFSLCEIDDYEYSYRALED